MKWTLRGQLGWVYVEDSIFLSSSALIPSSIDWKSVPIYLSRSLSLCPYPTIKLNSKKHVLFVSISFFLIVIVCFSASFFHIERKAIASFLYSRPRRLANIFNTFLIIAATAFQDLIVILNASFKCWKRFLGTVAPVCLQVTTLIKALIALTAGKWVEPKWGQGSYTS